MPRVLLLATTTGYQTRSFGAAAERLGVELVFATDRCQVLDDPWRDGAIAIRFHDEAGSAETIVAALEGRPIDGILVVGDRPTVIAAKVAQALGLPGHPPAAAAAARHKRIMREQLRAAGVDVPWFIATTVDCEPSTVECRFPCVVKPVAMSGSRGVMRADDRASLAAGIERLRALVDSFGVRAERDVARREMLIEGFIPGREYAVEAILHHGSLHLVTIFEKPDPLDGPFFEETIYVTPPDLGFSDRDTVARAVDEAATILGLRHGPIHAEVRANDSGVHVLEIAARPIGGLCARAVRFDNGMTLEERLLRHALGESPDAWQREWMASGVMMVPIPKRGLLRRVDGLDAARAVAGVDDVQITAKTDQLLLPLPEGASYLGFIFARAPRRDAVIDALRTSHAALHFAIDPELTLVAK